MALNIKDPETDRLARQLADLTGESITVAVKKALNDRIERERRRHSMKIDLAEVERIIARYAKLPVVDSRSPDELIGYDESGLPT